MTRSRLAAVALAAAALAWWLAGTPGLGGGHGGRGSGTGSAPIGRSIDPALQQQLGGLQLGRDRSGAIDLRSQPRGARDGVTISGKVIDDEDAHAGVGNVEVVFKNALGESSATTAADGTYKLDVAPGTYRAYVRDDDVLSVGVEDLVRLPNAPTADAAFAPEDGLMPQVVAVTDVDHVDLSVVYGGSVSGTVVDRAGHAVVGAVLRARGSDLRPALGTDIAESDEHGRFEMRLAPGQYAVEATHAQLAGATGNVVLTVERGQTAHPTVTLTAGCVISGRVIGMDGKPAGEGAIERRYGPGEDDYGPAGRIEADGTFRWVTGDATTSVELRAWPWKSPPAPAQAFACRDGARFANVVYRIPSQAPALAGTLVDASGQPVAFGFIDIAPTHGGFGQQERSDSAGNWAVYHMQPGRYRITATAPSRGVVATEVDGPKSGVVLALGGTGRIDGTTTTLGDGSFELQMQLCDGVVALPHAPRLVTVRGGTFSIDDVPACELTAVVSWEGEELELTATVPAGGAATTEVDIGPARPKLVRGVARDASGQPVVGATITGLARGARNAETTTTTDATGAYSLQSVAGAGIMATDPIGRQGFAQVAADAAPAETLDIVMSQPGETENENENENTD